MSYVKWDDYCDVSELVGYTLSDIQQDDDEIYFITECGRTFKMWHNQDCCESVYIEDVVGDWKDLIGTPIVSATEDSNEKDLGPLSEWEESYTWTFYNISTNRGSVTIRWYGSSNGYYSESVDFGEVK